MGMLLGQAARALGSGVAIAHDDTIFTAVFAAACGFALTAAIQRERRKIDGQNWDLASASLIDSI